MGIGDDELDATQTPPGQLSKKLGPDRLGLGCADLQRHQLLGSEADHLAQQIGVGALLNSERRFIMSSVIGGVPQVRPTQSDCAERRRRERISGIWTKWS